MRLEGYRHFGGRHWESAALKNTLDFQGVRGPDGAPLSEALCFGIAGGIAAGYSFCPSIPGWDAGSGVSAVGRFRAYATGPVFVEGCLKRLGARTDIRETGGVKKAWENLKQGLENGKPVMVWCGPLPVVPLSWSCSYGMYLTVVHGVDEASGKAWVGDCAPTPLQLELEQLEDCRGAVCSHNRRTLTFEPPKKLSAAVLKQAVVEGIRDCAEDFLRPKLKTYNLPGLLEWSKVIAKPGNKKGWPRVYPNGKILLAQRDVFESIETAGTGEGLFRLIYAEFLDEAAAISGKKALLECAETCRGLGQRWTAFAESLLPDEVKGFASLKKDYRERRRLFEEKGVQAGEKIGALTSRIRENSRRFQEEFPWNEVETIEFLESAGAGLKKLHEQETAAAEKLANSAGVPR